MLMTYAIISPCRNEARYMRETLESVIRQTVRPHTWIIVDDARARTEVCATSAQASLRLSTKV